MNKHLKYVRYITLHKYLVGVECFKRGLYWRGLKHDLSKFSRSEWSPYANFFDALPEDRTPALKQAFALSWNKHCKRNDHHWQWFVMNNDSSLEPRVYEMNEDQRAEMLCDWIGANKALGKNGHSDLRAWYAEREPYIQLGPKTKAWLKKELKTL